MGQIRFLVPRRDHLGQGAVTRAYLAGIDDIPWRTKISLQRDELIAERSDHDSAYFYIPWRVAGVGDVTLSTATLIEREAAYHLPLELARGTINRLRNQLAAWETLGLSPSPLVRQHIQTASQHFSRAAVSQDTDILAAADGAQSAIETAMQAIEILIDDYIEQSLAARRKSHAKIPTLQGCLAGDGLLEGFNTKEYLAAFDTACVPFNWREIEREQGRYDWSTVDRRMAWCQEQGIRVCAGPLLQLTPASAPDWIALWDGDFEHFLSFAVSFVQAAINRYRGRIALWHAAAGLNYAEVMDLGEEQRLRLAAHCLDTFRKSDPRAPVVLSIDQPWAEYMGRHDLDLSPVHFADALARADLGLAGIGFELNFGDGDVATLPRDWLEISRQIDRWTLLGLPVLIFPTMPNAYPN